MWIKYNKSQPYLHYDDIVRITHSSALVWKIPWTEEPGGLQSMGSRRVGRNWATSLWLFTYIHWRRKWQPTPVFLPGKSQGHGNLAGYSPWGLKRVRHNLATKGLQRQQWPKAAPLLSLTLSQLSPSQPRLHLMWSYPFINGWLSVSAKRQQTPWWQNLLT